MRTCKRPALWAMALLVAGTAGASTSAKVLAQEPVFVPIDCGPINILVGDFVAMNVGNAGRPPQPPVVVQVRLFDAEGSALLEQSLTLAPGQSRAVTARLAEGGLARGEVVPVSGPDDLRLHATMQVPPRARRLTYGPIVECAGPTGNRGPV